MACIQTAGILLLKEACHRYISVFVSMRWSFDVSVVPYAVILRRNSLRFGCLQSCGATTIEYLDHGWCNSGVRRRRSCARPPASSDGSIWASRISQELPRILYCLFCLSWRVSGSVSSQYPSFVAIAEQCPDFCMAIIKESCPGS